MGALLLLAALSALPARAEDPLSQLCGAAGASSCPGYVRPGGGRPSAPSEPKEPSCDAACQKAAEERHARAFGNMARIQPVPEIDEVGIREEKTIRGVVKSDQVVEASIQSNALIFVGLRMRNPWFAAAAFAGVVLIPRMHLEKYVPMLRDWASGWTFYEPAPKELDQNVFPGTRQADRKTPVPGVPGKLRPRWKDEDGDIYEWDHQHGRVERYNKRGKHKGEYDPKTGEQTKPAKPGREVEP